jgi:hypothetical protein
MSQDHASAKKTLVVRGDISAERLNAVLEKAGKQGYELGFSLLVEPDAGEATSEATTEATSEATTEAMGEEAPQRQDGAQDPR